MSKYVKDFKNLLNVTLVKLCCVAQKLLQDARVIFIVQGIKNG